MSAERVVYSIQQTYIIKPISKSEKRILTCNERIDIPTIESLPSVQPLFYQGKPLTVIPCIELAGEFLSEFDLTFETNEGVTVLPVRISQGLIDPVENPYPHFRYVLVLPRGATGVKTCKLIHKATGEEVQNNFTFGIMPPPYNYDNVLFGYIMRKFVDVGAELLSLQNSISELKLKAEAITFTPIELDKGAGKQTINIEDGVIFYKTVFIYPPSAEPIVHKPKITLHCDGYDQAYTLSLNKEMNAVSIDLLTGMITVWDVNGEIIKQHMMDVPFSGFNTLSFENFDDIVTSFIEVTPLGVRVE